jgi:hypothetical protein
MLSVTLITMSENAIIREVCAACILLQNRVGSVSHYVDWVFFPAFCDRESHCNPRLNIG